MKVIFNKSDLIGALDRVQRAAQTKVTSNTNNGIFISAAGGNILIQANDYTIGIKNVLSCRHRRRRSHRHCSTAAAVHYPHDAGRRRGDGKGRP